MSQNSEWHQAPHPQHAFWDNIGTRWVILGHKMIGMNLYIYLEICLSSRFLSTVLWSWMTQLVSMLSQNACCGWGAWCNSLSFEVFPFSNKQLANRCRWKVKVAQSSPTLCNPTGHTVHGILQARILEWVAFPFSRGSSQTRDWTQISHIAGWFFTKWAISSVQFSRSVVANSLRPHGL